MGTFELLGKKVNNQKSKTRNTPEDSFIHSIQEEAMDTRMCREQQTNPNTTLYNDELWEAGQGYCTYLRSRQAVLCMAFSSSISAIASLLLIYIILISPAKLSSIYHRIMFGIGISDIIYGLAKALTTLPMPAPGHDYWTDMVNIQGIRMGNIQTCTAQGFFINFGGMLEAGYYLGLCAYYVCSIGFNMRNESLKRVEPVLHVAAIAFATSYSLPAVFDGGYNAFFGTPTCTLVPKPWFCEKNINGGGEGAVECIRGAGEVSDVSPGSIQFLKNESGLVFLLLATLCLVLVCWKVFCRERKIKFHLEQLIRENQQDSIQLQAGMNYGTMYRPSSIPGTLRIAGTNTCISELLNTGSEEDIPIEEILDAYNHQYENTKVITFQSMLYLLSLSVIIFGCTNITSLQPSLVSWYKTMLLALSCILGVNNLWIFLFHKVFDLKRSSNSDLSTWDAITNILRDGGVHETLVITRMHLLSKIPAKPSVIDDDKDEDDSIVAVSENDVPRGEKMSERMDTPLLPMFETTIKRVSNQVKDRKPSPAFTTSVSNSVSPSYGCSANYGGSRSEKLTDSMQFSQSESYSVKNEAFSDFASFLSNLVSPSHGLSANYGNDSERSRDSMQLSYDSEINSVENAS